MYNHEKSLEPPFRIEQTSHNEIQIQSFYESKIYIDGLLSYLDKRQKTNTLQSQQKINVQMKEEHMYLGGLLNIIHLQQFISLQQKFALIFSHFTFRNIKTLNIPYLNINNCQFLTFIQMPALVSLSLENNKLTNLKPIIKMNLPQKLKRLDLQQNCVSQVKLQRLNLSKLTVQHVSIILRSQPRIVIQDLGLLAKIQTRQELPAILPDQNDMDEQQRIQQQQAGKAIWRKFYGFQNYEKYQQQWQQGQLDFQGQQQQEQQQKLQG